MGELLSVIAYTLQDETERGIEFSNLAKIGQFHGIRCSRILNLNFHYISYNWEIS